MLTKLILILAICASTQSLSHSTEKILVKEFEPQSKLSMETHKKIYSYTKNANFFKNLTFEETMDFMNELNEWEAPKEIKDHFGYSLWGYDLERRPVWYDGIGKQDIRWVVENGTFPELEKHFLKSVIHIVQSIQAADTPDDEIREAVIIWDMDGFSMRQVGHPQTLSSLVKMGTKFNDVPLEFAGKVFLINANYVTKKAVDIARPFMGNVLENVEVLPTNRDVWLPRLLTTFPLDIVPEWFGGNNNTKPLWVYGHRKYENVSS